MGLSEKFTQVLCVDFKNELFLRRDASPSYFIAVLFVGMAKTGQSRQIIVSLVWCGFLDGARFSQEDWSIPRGQEAKDTESSPPQLWVYLT